MVVVVASVAVVPFVLWRPRLGCPFTLPMRCRRFVREGHFHKFAFWCGIVQFSLLIVGVAIAVYWKRQRDRWLRDSDGIEFNEVVQQEKQPLLKSI